MTKYEIKKGFIRFIIFGLLGMLFEVFLGGLWKLFANGDPLLRGFSSIWMILDYGLFGVILVPMARPMIKRKIPLILRAFVYMIVIYIVEFISGWLFDICGLKVWDNSGLTYQLCGYVALRYAPFWYFIGFVGEYTYKRVDAIAELLLNKDFSKTTL